MHEYSKFLDLNALINGCASKNQLKRKNVADIEREEKINFFSSKLKEEEIGIQIFLEAMSNKDILPNTGNVLVRLFQ